MIVFISSNIYMIRLLKIKTVHIEYQLNMNKIEESAIIKMYHCIINIQP